MMLPITKRTFTNTAFSVLCVLLLSLTFSTKVFSQCNVCATCTTSTITNCKINVSANDASPYTFTFQNNKMCVTGGTYSGNLTINGGNNNITIVVASGATFAPASITYNV